MKRSTFKHPKLGSLAEELGVHITSAAGILGFLWDWAGEFTPYGNIGKYTNKQIAQSCHWPEDQSESLIEALVKSGWVDEDEQSRLQIHDWMEHCEEWVKKRIARMDRQRRDTVATASRQCLDNGETPHIETPSRQCRDDVETKSRNHEYSSKNASRHCRDGVETTSRPPSLAKPSLAKPVTSATTVATYQPSGSDPGRDQAERLAFEAIDRWCWASARRPMSDTRNETRRAQEFIASLWDEQPVLMHGKPVPKPLLVPRVVDQLIEKQTKFKKIHYAIGCIRGELQEMADYGAENPDSDDPNAITDETIKKFVKDMERRILARKDIGDSEDEIIASLIEAARDTGSDQWPEVADVIRRAEAAMGVKS